MQADLRKEKLHTAQLSDTLAARNAEILRLRNARPEARLETVKQFDRLLSYGTDKAAFVLICVLIGYFIDHPGVGLAVGLLIALFSLSFFVAAWLAEPGDDDDA